MDGLYQYLRHKNLSQKVSTIMAKLKDEEYDSEGLMNDAADSKDSKNSNIFLFFGNDALQIQEYAYSNKRLC